MQEEKELDYTDKWLQIEYGTCVEIASNCFEQLIVLAKSSLVFNAALTAGFAFVVDKYDIVGAITGVWAGQESTDISVPIVCVALIVLAALGVIFNLGALRSHNNSWVLLERVAKRFYDIAPQLPEGSRRCLELPVIIYEENFVKARKRARPLNVLFYNLLILLWGLMGVCVFLFLIKYLHVLFS